MYSRAPLFFSLFSFSSLNTHPVDVARDCRSGDANQRPRGRDCILFSSSYSDFFSLGRRPNGRERERESCQKLSLGQRSAMNPYYFFFWKPQDEVPAKHRRSRKDASLRWYGRDYFCFVRYGNLCELRPRAKWDGEESLHAHEEGGIERNHSVPPSTVSHFPVLLFRSRRNFVTGG